MKFKTKIQILLAFAAAAVGFAAGRTSASLRICPASCPVKTPQDAVSPRESSASGEPAEEKISAQTSRPEPPDRSSEIPASAEIEKPSPKHIGNRLSKVFHDASCRYCSGASGKYRMEFDSENDARSQGYKPCRRCLPEEKKEETDAS